MKIQYWTTYTCYEDGSRSTYDSSLKSKVMGLRCGICGEYYHALHDITAHDLEWTQGGHVIQKQRVIR